jgi:hypothetical protein
MIHFSASLVFILSDAVHGSALKPRTTLDNVLHRELTVDDAKLDCDGGHAPGTEYPWMGGPKNAGSWKLTLHSESSAFY